MFILKKLVNNSFQNHPPNSLDLTLERQSLSYMHGVTANFSISYFHHAKFQILLTKHQHLFPLFHLVVPIFRVFTGWLYLLFNQNNINNDGVICWKFAFVTVVCHFETTVSHACDWYHANLLNSKLLSNICLPEQMEIEPSAFDRLATNTLTHTSIVLFTRQQFNSSPLLNFSKVVN